MKRLELPGDHWADIRSADEVPEGQWREITRLATAHERTMPLETRKAAAALQEKQQAARATVEKPAPEDAEEVDENTAAAFGPPPEAEEKPADGPELAELVEFLTFDLTSDETLAAWNAYNDARIKGYVSAWSFGEVTEEVAHGPAVGRGNIAKILTAISRDYGANVPEEPDDEELDPPQP